MMSIGNDHCHHEPQKFTSMSVADIRSKFSLRSRETLHILQFFADQDMPQELLEITVPIREMAFLLTMTSLDGTELCVALRNLFESKEAFIRHYLVTHNFQLVFEVPVADS